MQIIVVLILICLLILLFSKLPRYGKGILIAIIVIPIIIGIFLLILLINSKDKNTNLTSSITESYNPEPTPVFNNPNEKCVTEDGNLKICDLSFSSIAYNQTNRNILTEGNTITCVDMTTGDVSEGGVGKLRATTNTAFCVTDWGYIYIDPSLRVSKHYKDIVRDDYNKPYKVNQLYDTCLWSYNDGSGSIPYLEVLSNVGPRSGYNVKAFCVNGQSQVDIYTGQN